MIYQILHRESNQRRDPASFKHETGPPPEGLEDAFSSDLERPVCWSRTLNCVSGSREPETVRRGNSDEMISELRFLKAVEALEISRGRF